MPLKIVISPQANLDLEEHFNYIAANDMDAAISFFDAVRETFSQLAKNPNIGSVYEIQNFRLQGVRKWKIKRFDKYFIFYRHSEEILEAIRLIHGSRDIPSILAEE